MASPLISAALIVRDEEKFLAGCLESLLGFADEVIVVDTGSVDATPQIAEAHGADVHHFAWCDDFSAARNFGLSLASGEWILYIDADERIRSGASETREALLDPEYIGYNLLLAPKPGMTPYWIIRLFRNRPAIRFRGIIHENIWPALTEYQSLNGGKIGNLPLELDHFGYQENQSFKNERNLPLLRRALELDPERIFCWCHLAAILRDQGDLEGSRNALTTAMDLVRKRSFAIDDDSFPWNDLIASEMAQNRAVTDLIDEALERFPDELQFRWYKGRDLMKLKEFDSAIPYFDQLINAGVTGEFVKRASYDKRLMGVLACESRATCYFRLGRWAEAERDYELALKHDPQRMDLRTKAALARNRGLSRRVS